MTKQAEQQVDRGQGSRAQPEPAGEFERPPADLISGQLDRFGAPGEPPQPIEAHAARLGDRRIPAVQRQRYALRVGRRHGNRFLQRVVAHVPGPAVSSPAGTVARDYGPEHSQVLQSSGPGRRPVALIFRVDPDTLEMDVRPDGGTGLPAGLSAEQIEELLSLHRGALSDEPPLRRREGDGLVYSLDALSQVDWDVLARTGMVPSDQVPVEEAAAGAEQVEELEFEADMPVGPVSEPEARRPMPPGERVYQPTTAAYGGPVAAEATTSWPAWDPRHATRRVPRSLQRLEAYRAELESSRTELAELEAAAAAGSLSPRQARRRRFLRTRMRELPRQIAAEEAEVTPAPPQERHGSVALVEVDLTASGVQIKTAGGRTMGREHTRLDPVFAEAMINFLRALAGEFNVAAMRSAGFLRPPISAQDPHPLGQACDITGFETRDGEQILLRSGQQVLHDEANFAAEHSDWFDNHQQIRATRETHMNYMRRIANRMPAFFGSISGPGSDELHMNHFHVQLIGYRGEAGALNAPATITDPYPFQRRRGR